MTSDATLASLLDEAARLDRQHDGHRLLAIYDAAAALVDRRAKPKQWAALRHLAGVTAFADPARLDVALAAFRDSLPNWDPVAEREQWAGAASYIGTILFLQGCTAPPESEEAIACLEATVADDPDDTPRMLAQLYGRRLVGDPLENWRKHVFYLEASGRTLSLDADPVRWAHWRNDLALAASREPDGDFAAAIERRIGLHREALAAVAPFAAEAGSAAQAAWIGMAVDCSEAVLSRVGSDGEADRRDAERLARDALAACGPATPRDVAWLAVMALARVLIGGDAGAATSERCMQALALCDRAETLVDATADPLQAATLFKARANAHLLLLRLGHGDQVEPLRRSVDAALALLDPARHGATRVTLMQIAADGLVAAGDFSDAAGYLVGAEQEGERALARATTNAGRLECIFDLHDASSLLGWCRLQTGDLAGAVEAIDRNKARLWRRDRAPVAFAEMRRCVPPGGALLFAAFAANEAAVVVVTGGGEQRCDLPGFGLVTLRQLLFDRLHDGDSDSWLARYLHRGRDAQAWSERIDSIGGVLFERVWAPLLATLQAMGVEPGAELVWLPQAGLGVLPLHAAWVVEGGERHWIGDRFSVRFASSAGCLLANRSRPARATPPRSLVVVNPDTGLADLPYAAFEAAWLRAAAPPGDIDVLAGAAARRDAVVAALPASTTAHFATHGVFDVADATRSRLLLAGGEALTLDALLPLIAASPPARVVLSACETAVAPSWRRADEMVGFPAALVEHGVETVIASLWPVDDFATAALLGRFYRSLHGPSRPTAAQALGEAQRWLREVTVAELRSLLAGLEAESGNVARLAAEVRLSLADSNAGVRLFAHPQFWAAFTVTGA